MKVQKIRITDPDVVGALKRGRGIFENNSFRIVVSPDPDGGYLSRCLEMGVLTGDWTAEDALERVVEAMAFHVECYLDVDLEGRIFPLVPQGKYWWCWLRALLSKNYYYYKLTFAKIAECSATVKAT